MWCCVWFYVYVWCCVVYSMFVCLCTGVIFQSFDPSWPSTVTSCVCRQDRKERTQDTKETHSTVGRCQHLCLSLCLPLSISLCFLCLFVCWFPSLTFDRSTHTSSPLKHRRPTHNNRDEDKSSICHFICCSCGPQ